LTVAVERWLLELALEEKGFTWLLLEFRLPTLSFRDTPAFKRTLDWGPLELVVGGAFERREVELGLPDELKG
jgi:hypothetical protein